MYSNTPNRMLVLSRKKAAGTLIHWAVQLPDGRVAHFLPNRGFIVTSPEEFTDGQDVSIIRPVSTDRYQLVLERFHLAQTHPHRVDLPNWNFQSFTNRLLKENPASPDTTVMSALSALFRFLGLTAHAQ